MSTDAVAAALARTVASKIQQSRTVTRRGTVTAVGSDGTVQFSVGALGTRIGISVGDPPPEVGDVIAYLDEGTGMPLVLGTVGKPALPEPRFYSGAVSNGTSTSAAAFLTQNSILTAPRDLTMVVQVAGNQGANGAANDVGYAIWDEAGNNIMVDIGAIVASTLIIRNTGVDERSCIAMQGQKAYTAGQTCGFRVVYSVSGSNIYASVGAVVSFHADL